MIIYKGNLKNIPEFEVNTSDHHYSREIVGGQAQGNFRSIPVPSNCRCHKFSCSPCRMAFDVCVAEMATLLYGASSEVGFSTAFSHEYRFSGQKLLELDWQTLGLRGAKLIRDCGLPGAQWLGITDVVVTKCFPNDGEEKWTVWSFMATNSLSDALQQKLRIGLSQPQSIGLQGGKALGVTYVMHFDNSFYGALGLWRRHVMSAVNRMSPRAKRYRNEFLSKGTLGDNIILFDSPKGAKPPVCH